MSEFANFLNSGTLKQHEMHSKLTSSGYTHLQAVNAVRGRYKVPKIQTGKMVRVF